MVGRSRRFELDKFTGRDLVDSILDKHRIPLDLSGREELLSMIKSREKGNFSVEEFLGAARSMRSESAYEKMI
jgi:hypothetical protein